MTQPSNVSALHRLTTESLADRTAVRHKQGGAFVEISWQQYRNEADALALGLLDLGVEVGDHVAILSENRYEWLLADLATMAIGAVNVPLHASLSPEQVVWQLGDSGAKGIILSDHEQAAKTANAKGLEFLIHFDAIDSVPAGSTEKVVPLSTLLSNAVQNGKGDARVIECEASLGDDALASIVYTSGTTATPKGVMLSHRNILFMVDAFEQTIRPEPGHGVLSWLPLTHIYGRAADHYMAVKFGSVLCLAESQQTLVEDLAATTPRWFFAVPQFFDRLWLKIGALPEEHRQPALRGIVGPNMDRMTSGGAPLAPHVASGFAAAGCPIYEGYGMTETTSVITMQPFGQCRPGTVGTALVGTEIRLADDCEILVRGPHVMKGYWNDAAATQAVLEDGWLRTGDLGSIGADGFLTVVGRKKDLFVTSNGKNVNPAAIESSLVQDPCISMALAIGDGRPHLAALVVPDFEILKAVRDLDLEALADPDGLVRHPDVLALFRGRIDEALRGLSSHEQIRHVLVLGRPLRSDHGEITATAKIRRDRVLEGYSEQIEACYA